jgi:hypothetical protein
VNTSWIRSWSFAASAVVLAAVAIAPLAITRACPFCSAVSMTLGEELKSSDAAVIATLVDRPPSVDAAAGGNPAKSKFKITKVLKGEKLLADKPTIEMLYFGTQDPGATFLIFGVDPKELAWGTPNALTDEGTKYIEKVAELTEDPAERLAFFQEYFENPDQLLQGDAFNEFAKAPYADVVQLKDKMHREKLIEWIKDEKVPPSRRRLYLTMLGMCGTPDDVPMIEGMIKTEDRQVRSALDAMIGCYLNLRGADGLTLIEDQFLKNDKSEYVDTYSAIVALRVLGQETDVIPKEKLVASLRHMLDRPQLADLVIPDLARWQDWGSVGKLVDLFKNANEESSWVRVPVVQFLRACPDPKAKEYIDELAKIDPDAVKRATNYLALPGAGGPAVATTAAPAKVEEPAAASTEGAPVGIAAELANDATKGVTESVLVVEGAAAADKTEESTEEQAKFTVADSAANPENWKELESNAAAADKQEAPSEAETPKKKRPEIEEPYNPTRNYENVADDPHEVPADSKAKKPSGAATLPVASDWGVIAAVVAVVAVGSIMFFRR